MTDKEIKLNIQESIKAFKNGQTSNNAVSLFSALGYRTDRQNRFIHKTYQYFKDSFLDGARFNEEKALVKDWKEVDLLFQLTKNEISGQQGLFETKRVDRTIIETYLFFSIELSKTEYTRTALSQITREVNKVFPMPVMILFKYGTKITLSVINRRLNEKNVNRDVLEKVTLIKDINVDTPHRAHVEILFDISFNELLNNQKFTNFVELHNAWQKTLDSKELNKKFYKELSNWYFWAMNEVFFPGASLQSDKSSLFKKEEKENEHNAKNLIRLLTRVLFIWFVKEKNLIPDELFDEDFIKDKLLKDFEPNKKKEIGHKTNGSAYYRAILQNLFFATLNQTAGKREFRKSGQHMNVTNLMRYETYFKDSKLFLKLVESVVPFMNGGLFECLDKPALELKGKKGGDVIVYEDSFSDRNDNKLTVPDYIFFGTQSHVDLSEVLGDSKKGDVEIRGLIDILESYKFTITENTPIEEDIALDPELLGQVFENLLASYNPETKTTARKQTGSFYTPREIVNYMVDESLKAYFKQKLKTEAGMSSGDAEAGLALLIGYHEKEHLFDKKQTDVLINAIDECKILDPACGSGAFPMGILHKLVHVLHKLDPKNEKWKERQNEKARRIDDVTIREQLIEDIETAFASNELDYGRKLYLIENCIYGVDIQPIAIQISKLRFFISLIVDQNVHKEKENFGVRPLPNLETKFVAANTLVGIEKPKSQGSFFDNKNIDILEKKLKDVRHRLFSVKSPSTKRKLRDDDKLLREKMGSLLVSDGWNQESARQLAGWDPYDQNSSSPFFDSEWMFGLIAGFDIVIGNPPYVNTKRGIEKTEKEYYKNIYKSASGQFDIFCLFIERALVLGNILSFIVPKPIINNENYLVCRKIMLENGLRSVVIGSNIFEAAGVESCIFVCDKASENKISIFKYDDGKFLFQWETDKNVSKDLPFEMINTELDEKNLLLIKAISLNNKTLVNILNISRGIEAGKNDESISGRKTKYKLLRGGDVTSYSIDYHNLFIDYDKDDISKFKPMSIYEGEKILIRRVGNELVATIDVENYLTLNTIYNCKPINSETNLYFILGIINSSLIKNWFKKLFVLNDKLFPYVRVSQLNFIPIKTNPLFEKPIEIIAKYIIFCKKLKLNQSNLFECLIDALVCELYFPDEIKLSGCGLLKQLGNLLEFKEIWGDEKKTKVVDDAFKEFSDPTNPVNITLKKIEDAPDLSTLKNLLFENK